MIDALKAELTELDAQIEQAKANLNQLIGAKAFCEFVITTYGEEGAGDEPAPKMDEPQDETITSIEIVD